MRAPRLDRGPICLTGASSHRGVTTSGICGLQGPTAWGGAGPGPADDSSPTGVPAPGGHAGRSASCGGGGGYARAFVTGCVRCGPTRSVGARRGTRGLACPCFLHPAGPLSSRRQSADQGPGGRSRVGRNSVQTWRRVVGTARGVGARRPVWARFAPRFAAATVRVAKRGRFCPAGESRQGARRAFRTMTNRARCCPDSGVFRPARSCPDPGRVSWPAGGCVGSASAATCPRRWRRAAGGWRRAAWVASGRVGGVGPCGWRRAAWVASGRVGGVGPRGWRRARVGGADVVPGGAGLGRAGQVFAARGRSWMGGVARVLKEPAGAGRCR